MKHSPNRYCNLHTLRTVVMLFRFSVLMGSEQNIKELHSKFRETLSLLLLLCKHFYCWRKRRIRRAVCL